MTQSICSHELRRQFHVARQLALLKLLDAGGPFPPLNVDHNLQDVHGFGLGRRSLCIGEEGTSMWRGRVLGRMGIRGAVCLWA